jgi:hypothetical protein
MVHAKQNNYGLSQETLENAKAYMVKEGYMDPSDDIIDFTRVMVEDINFMVKAKITQWATAYRIENSQNS